MAHGDASRSNVSAPAAVASRPQQTRPASPVPTSTLTPFSRAHSMTSADQNVTRNDDDYLAFPNYTTTPMLPVWDHLSDVSIASQQWPDNYSTNDGFYPQYFRLMNVWFFAPSEGPGHNTTFLHGGIRVDWSIEKTVVDFDFVQEAGYGLGVPPPVDHMEMTMAGMNDPAMSTNVILGLGSGLFRLANVRVDTITQWGVVAIIGRDMIGTLEHKLGSYFASLNEASFTDSSSLWGTSTLQVVDPRGRSYDLPPGHY